MLKVTDTHRRSTMAKRTEKTNHIDQMIGQKIKRLRRSLGISQMQLAHLIGVTHQQAHKYERGSNRISVGRLVVIAEALKVPVHTFFDEAAEKIGDLNTHQRLSLEVGRYFSCIKHPKHKEAVHFLLRTLAETEGDS